MQYSNLFEKYIYSDEFDNENRDNVFLLKFQHILSRKEVLEKLFNNRKLILEAINITNDYNLTLFSLQDQDNMKATFNGIYPEGAKIISMQLSNSSKNESIGYLMSKQDNNIGYRFEEKLILLLQKENIHNLFEQVKQKGKQLCINITLFKNIENTSVATLKNMSAIVLNKSIKSGEKINSNNIPSDLIFSKFNNQVKLFSENPKYMINIKDHLIISKDYQLQDSDLLNSKCIRLSNNLSDFIQQMLNFCVNFYSVFENESEKVNKININSTISLFVL